MDLLSMLNKTENGERNAQNQPAPPPSHQRPAQPPPTQSPQQYQRRDYLPHQAAPPPPSPGRSMSHDYPNYSPRQPHPTFPPPASPYAAPGPSPIRTTGPPLQPANTFRDVQSPSIAATPGRSPYRTSSTTPGHPRGEYPFPPTQSSPDMQSPAQRHSNPPTMYHHQQAPPIPMPTRQDSHPHAMSPHVSVPHVQPLAPQQHGPQTPTAPGAAYSYPQQRPQSSQSMHTPTSAHSQHQYGQQFVQGSPVASARPAPYEYNRQSSQPPTPGGHPMSAGPRQPLGGFAQPSSPHQQRLSSTPGVAAGQPHSSPALAHPALGQAAPHRMSGVQSTHSSPPTDQTQQHRPASQREHSMSLSPKTRVSSFSTNPDRPLMSRESESRPAPHLQHLMADQDTPATPAKRKLEDRDLSPRELERRETRPPPGEMNGSRPTTAHDSQPPPPLRRKRIYHAQPPIWAQSAHSLGKKLPIHANFVLQKRGAPQVNGKKDSLARNDRTSRHPSSEANKAPPSSKQPSAPPVEAGPRDILGAWEPSITGIKPFEEVSRTVADYLFINVINNEDIGEIMSRGIQFEIEAKLGLLIDRDTNQRVYRSLASECILADTGRVAFKSTMTEAHHKKFNEFLNQVVMDSHPQAPSGANRVQVHYKHRRETDRFFELSPALQERLPGCVRARLGSRAKSVKARVTYDQKTDEVLAKIVKARVADLDLHMPKSPMDCRISINLEMNWDGPIEELERSASASTDRQPDRKKDRLSYSQGHYQVDLTQVTQSSTGPANNARIDKEHELEIEIAPGIVIDQGRRAAQGAPHRYQELVEGLVDNIRLLARKAAEFA